MPLTLFRPRLFLSYSRADREAADALCNWLQAQDCVVWMDRNEILVGDDFVRALTLQLATKDGLVLLLTANSAQSSWCHAEVQHALATKLPVFVVQQGEQARLPDALERQLRDVQRLSGLGAEAELGIQIQRARTRRRRRLFVRAASLAVLAAAVLSTVWFSIRQINEFALDSRVDAVVAGLGTAAMVVSGDEIRTRIEPVRAAPGLAAALRAVSDDPARAVTARINAWQALDALQSGRQREWRSYVPEIQWSGGRLADTLWANTSYGGGTIGDLHVERLRMAGLVFAAGPVDGKPGMSLLGARIADSDIWFLRLDGTQLLDVEFTNSKFRGAQLDLSGAAGVRFLSRAKSDHIITADVAIIEDSWIVQRRPPPGPGVLDLARPEQEILFDGVQFARVRFEGYFKPAWFRNSHFVDCVFATGLDAQALASGGNSEEGSVFVGGPSP